MYYLKNVNLIMKILGVVCYFLLAVFIIFTCYVLFGVGSPYINWCAGIDEDLAARFGDFYGGVMGPVVSLLGAILLVITIVNQNLANRRQDIRDKFFKMIDYHNEIVSQFLVVDDSAKEYRGREAFIHLVEKHKEIYKALQVKDGDIYTKALLQFMKPEEGKEIELRNAVNNLSKADKKEMLKGFSIDLDENDPLTNWAYMLLYEGFVKGNKSIKVKYVDKNGKPNDWGELTVATNRGNYYNTYLSVYFRNLYNAIKLVHLDDSLQEHKKKSKCKKYQLVSMLRAQLSNSEIYILFFNTLSKYGEKWDNKENSFVQKYHFIKNISKVDMDDISINPRDYFPDIDYENDFPAPKIIK